MTRNEKRLAATILVINMSVGIALVRGADFSELFPKQAGEVVTASPPQGPLPTAAPLIAPEEAHLPTRIARADR